MIKIVIFTALVAVAAAAPGLILHETPVVAVPVASKSTITHSSHAINHGGHAVLHAPVVHAPVIHAPVIHAVHTPVVVSSKSTITKSSHAINHGGHAVLHAPVVHAPVVHAVPAVHAVHAVHHIHAPLVTLKTGDHAVSHTSQSVHETVPVVKTVYSLHH